VLNWTPASRQPAAVWTQVSLSRTDSVIAVPCQVASLRWAQRTIAARSYRRTSSSVVSTERYAKSSWRAIHCRLSSR
jgi:hypothetical protein